MLGFCFLTNLLSVLSLSPNGFSQVAMSASGQENEGFLTITKHQKQAQKRRLVLVNRIDQLHVECDEVIVSAAST
jgi:hypothetical protein